MHTSHILLLAAGSAASVAAFAPASTSLRATSLARSATCAAAANVRMLQEGESFPDSAATKFGIKGKNAVVYFYGADGSPSCTKQAIAFDQKAAEFKDLGFEVVGVRSDKQAKGEFEEKYSQRFVADTDNEVRKVLGIKNDLFGVLSGRETYVVDRTGTVKMVFNDQFKTDEHVEKALAAAAACKGGRQGSFIDELKTRIGSIGVKV